MSRNRRRSGIPALLPALALLVGLLGGGLSGCSGKKPRASLQAPEPLLPSMVYFGSPARKYEVLGSVRATKTYSTLNQDLSDEQEEQLCRRAFTDAARDLLRNARDNGGDAVVDVHSVVFLMDGRRETFDKPQCTDDGEEGEALVQGIAVKWGVTAPQAAPKAAKPQGIPGAQ